MLIDRAFSIIAYRARTMGHGVCTLAMATIRHDLGQARGRKPGERSVPRALRQERAREGTPLRWAPVRAGDSSFDGIKAKRKRVAYWVLTPAELREEARRAKVARRRAREAARLQELRNALPAVPAARAAAAREPSTLARVLGAAIAKAPLPAGTSTPPAPPPDRPRAPPGSAPVGEIDWGSWRDAPWAKDTKS